jgi:hypothetical protein
VNRFMVLAAAAAASLALGATAQAQDAQPKAQNAPTAPAEPAQPATPAQSPAAAEASSAAQAAPGGATGKGHIIFFRPTRLSGAFYTYHIVEVGDDGKPAKGAPHLGDLRNGGAFAVDVEPGIHAYNITGPMAVNKAQDRLRMEVEPGETYYVEQTVRIGLVTGGFRLAPADAARFKQSNTKLK